MVMLLPKLFALIFVVIIVWVAWRLIKATNSSIENMVDDIIGDEIDEIADIVEREINTQERTQTTAEKIKQFKKTKVNDKANSEEIDSFLQNL